MNFGSCSCQAAAPWKVVLSIDNKSAVITDTQQSAGNPHVEAAFDVTMNPHRRARTQHLSPETIGVATDFDWKMSSIHTSQDSATSEHSAMSPSLLLLTSYQKLVTWYYVQQWEELDFLHTIQRSEASSLSSLKCCDFVAFVYKVIQFHSYLIPAKQKLPSTVALETHSGIDGKGIPRSSVPFSAP